MHGDGILVVYDIAQKVLVVLPDARQIRNPPPTGIGVRIVLEVEPAAVFGVRVGNRVLKIPAPASHMGKHAVENHLHPPCMRVLAQSPEIFLGPQHRVDASVVAGVVPVRGKREENRVQIQKLHAQLLQIRKLFPDSGEISAVKVVVPDLSVLVRQIHRHVLLVLMHPVRL